MATNPNDNALVCLGPIRTHGNDTYSEDKADEICERIAAGETLTAICLDEHMPPIRTVSRWLMKREEFAAKYAHARETQMHLEAEQIREIADNAYEDYYIDYKEVDGEMRPFVVVNNESIKRAQLRIDARKWRAERLNRRVYGNSIKHELDATVHPANGAEQLPAGLDWLARQLPQPQPAAGPEPDDSGVGEA